MEYNESLEFKELLNRYERSKQEGQLCYLDSDDFEDIAEYYLRENRPDDSLEAIEDGLALHKDDEFLLCLKCNALINLNRFDEAQTITDTLDPEVDHDVYFFKGQLACGKDHDVETALRFFKKWIKIEKQDCDRMENRDEAAYRYREAFLHVVVSYNNFCKKLNVEEDLNYWLDKYINECSPLPGDDINLDLSNVYHDQGMIRREIDIYTLVLDSNPYLHHGWTYLATLQCLVGDSAASINSAEFALAIDSNDSQALLVKSHGYFNLDNYSESTKGFKKYLDKTKDEYYTVMIGVSLMREGKKEESLLYLDRAKVFAAKEMKKKDERAAARAMIADAYMRGGYFKDALHLINLAIRSENHNNDYKFEKGLILLEKGEPDKATNIFFDILLLLREKEVVRYCLMVGAEFMLRDYYDSAIFFFSRASRQKKDPTHVKAFVHLAQAYDLMGYHKLFLGALKKACKLTPELVLQCWKNDLDSVDEKDYFKTLKRIYKL